MIEKRELAKREKNYVLADEIRNKLNEDGIVLKDTREGTIYEIINERMMFVDYDLYIIINWTIPLIGF